MGIPWAQTPRGADLPFDRAPGRPEWFLEQETPASVGLRGSRVIRLGR